jgi:mono/diheme cytochrome c family protein
MGPSLKALFKKEKLASNGKPVNDANVLEVINKGGNGMPGYEEMLTEEERTDLMAYLKTI